MSKARNGDGALWLDPNTKKWIVEISLQSGPGGTRRRTRRTFDTQRMAKMARRRLIADRYGGVSQGTGVSVGVKTGDGKAYLVTAGHVIENCRYKENRSVTVVYKGIKYPGEQWAYFSDPDLGSVVTTAPVPSARLAIGAANRPQVGDVGIAIGAAGGVVGTTTQGMIVGVSDSILNTTIPSGPGASGGPVFNNEGGIIGFVTAGNGSLTQLTALPALCGTVYVAPCYAAW